MRRRVDAAAPTPWGVCTKVSTKSRTLEFSPLQIRQAAEGAARALAADTRRARRSLYAEAGLLYGFVKNEAARPQVTREINPHRLPQPRGRPEPPAFGGREALTNRGARRCAPSEGILGRGGVSMKRGGDWEEKNKASGDERMRRKTETGRRTGKAKERKTKERKKEVKTKGRVRWAEVSRQLPRPTENEEVLRKIGKQRKEKRVTVEEWGREGRRGARRTETATTRRRSGVYKRNGREGGRGGDGSREGRTGRRRRRKDGRIVMPMKVQGIMEKKDRYSRMLYSKADAFPSRTKNRRQDRVDAMQKGMQGDKRHRSVKQSNVTKRGWRKIRERGSWGGRSLEEGSAAYLVRDGWRSGAVADKKSGPMQTALGCPRAAEPRARKQGDGGWRAPVEETRHGRTCTKPLRRTFRKALGPPTDPVIVVAASPQSVPLLSTTARLRVGDACIPPPLLSAAARPQHAEAERVQIVPIAPEVPRTGIPIDKGARARHTAAGFPAARQHRPIARAPKLEARALESYAGLYWLGRRECSSLIYLARKAKREHISQLVPLTRNSRTRVSKIYGAPQASSTLAGGAQRQARGGTSACPTRPPRTCSAPYRYPSDRGRGRAVDARSAVLELENQAVHCLSMRRGRNLAHNRPESDGVTRRTMEGKMHGLGADNAGERQALIDEEATIAISRDEGKGTGDRKAGAEESLRNGWRLGLVFLRLARSCTNSIQTDERYGRTSTRFEVPLPRIRFSRGPITHAYERPSTQLAGVRVKVMSRREAFIGDGRNAAYGAAGLQGTGNAMWCRRRREHSARRHHPLRRDRGGQPKPMSSALSRGAAKSGSARSLGCQDVYRRANPRASQVMTVSTRKSESGLWRNFLFGASGRSFKTQSPSSVDGPTSDEPTSDGPISSKDRQVGRVIGEEIEKRKAAERINRGTRSRAYIPA
ncbi:hypothetical protein C8R47DRAFT_1201983 [Mycena vitilis]|nr:hypothetical protein C8R47DRAFT_1201983 [Mycena vitilis]